MTKIIFQLILLLFFLQSCQTNSKQSQIKLNDTTQLLRLAFQQGISLRSMPDAGSLIDSALLGDTILLTSYSIPFRLLPLTLDSIHLKFIPKDKICNFIENHFDKNHDIHYLELMAFEKSDTGYYVNVKCISCGRYSNGGSLGLYYQANKDTFILKTKSSGSIN